MKNISSIALFLLVSFLTIGQRPGEVVDTDVHKIVIQFSRGDSIEQMAIVGQLGNIRSSLPNAQIEVVCHSSGLDVLTISKSAVAKAIGDLAAKGVVFAACNNTMRRLNLKKDDLLPVSVIVPSAMVELVLKQEKGWAYLKGAH